MPHQAIRIIHSNSRQKNTKLAEEGQLDPLFARAAHSVREAVLADGVVILDLSFGGGAETPKNSKRDGDTDSSEVSSTETSNGKNSFSGVSNN